MGSGVGGARGGSRGWLHKVVGEASACESGGDSEVDKEARVAAAAPREE